MRTRKTGPDDIPALKALWKQAFGDTDAEIDSFFKTVYPEATGFCAEEDGAVIAMLFALPLTLAHGEETQKAAYLYAVATDEAFRGRGVCRALMEFAERTLRKHYVSCLLLVPETEKLASYYETMGYALQTLRADAPQGAAAVVTPQGAAAVVTPQEYAGLRETLLFDVPHTRYSKAQLDYAAEDLDFYRLEQGYALGCAAVRRAGQIVEELLPDARMLPALAAALGAGQYPVKTPGHGTMNCMAKWLDAEKQTAPIWLAFDFD